MVTYDLSLSEWICIGLHKDTLDSAVGTIRRGENLWPLVGNYASNRKYLDKILREELQKQFSSSSQPLVQLAMNSIDAKPDDHEGIYRVDVDIGNRIYRVADRGCGMSLDEILRLLIIPFNTEKDPSKTYGWRGVGFLSSLENCLDNPGRGKVIVETSTEDEAERIVFYSTSDIVSDIRMRVQKRGKWKKSGTDVSIRGNDMGKKKDTVDYITHKLENIPEYVALIYVNGKPINGHKDKKVFSRWYTSPANVVISGKKEIQPVGLRFVPGTDMRNWISITSEGAAVQYIPISPSYNGPSVVVSFPRGAKVVEGWDEFKQDKNYSLCAEAVFAAYAEYLAENCSTIHSPYAKTQFLNRNILLLPSLASAFSISKLRDIPGLDALKQVLLPGKRYALDISEMDKFRSFFGSAGDELAFEAKYEALAYWREEYGGMKEALNGTLTTVDSVPSVCFFAKARSSYPNLVPLARCLDKRSKYSQVDLVRYAVPVAKIGESPIIADSLSSIRDRILINLEHPHVQGPFNKSKAYSLAADFLLRSENSLGTLSGQPRYAYDAWDYNAEYELMRAMEDLSPEPVKQGDGKGGDL